MNSIYNLLFQDTENLQKQEGYGLFNVPESDSGNYQKDFANTEINRQQTQMILRLGKLYKDEGITEKIYQILQSKLCCFIEMLYFSDKYRFSDIHLQALREDSLYLTLEGNKNISINLFVDEDEVETSSNEEEIFLSYSKNGKDYITCDTISNIFSIIDNL